MFNHKVFIVLFIFSCFGCSASAGIVFDLSNYKQNDSKTHMQDRVFNISESFAAISVTNIVDDIGFYIIQVHSFMQDITLAHENVSNVHSRVTGRNIGLLKFNNNETNEYFLAVNETNSRILIVISIYNETDPIPGGCNLVFNTEYAPYQKVSLTNELIAVDFQPASHLDSNCDINEVELEKYHIFMPEYDRSEVTYFQYIKYMLTEENIMEHARKVTDIEGGLKYKNYYVSYKGTGEIFVLIAKYQNKTSVYIPIVSYGCDISKWDETCVEPISTLWKCILALSCLAGLFICFFGHMFFTTTISIMAFVFGTKLIFIILVLSAVPMEASGWISLLTAPLFSVMAIFCWYKKGSPMLSTFITYILAFILMTSILIYINIGTYYLFAIMLFCSVALLTSLCYGHIICCALLGAYGSILAFSYYFGGYLQHIILNLVYAFTVDNFNYAITDPPYQFKDYTSTLIWIFLLFCGLITQLRFQRGRAPFPFHRNQLRYFRVTTIYPNDVGERDPLLPPLYE